MECLTFVNFETYYLRQMVLAFYKQSEAMRLLRGRKGILEIGSNIYLKKKQRECSLQSQE